MHMIVSLTQQSALCYLVCYTTYPVAVVRELHNGSTVPARA